MEKEKAASPSRGQGPDKAVIKSRQRGQAGQANLGRTRGGHRVCHHSTRTAGGDQDTQGSQKWPLGGRRTTPGGPEKDTGFASMVRGEHEDNRRTTPEHQVQGRGQRLWPVFVLRQSPQQLTIWGKGQDKDKRSTRGEQDPDTEFRGAASQLSFS